MNANPVNAAVAAAQIDASAYDYRALNERVREQGGDCVIRNCLGHRFIGSGLSGVTLTIDGVPGNALGAYLDGATIVVNGNAQDAVGDTMNAGRIVIHGNVGDAVGYAMRGGEIFVEGNAGYRAGIHMKAYKDRLPVMVIGGGVGSFLGEYQAGGRIVVLGIGCEGRALGNFPATGMHGGKVFLRGDYSALSLPKVNVALANAEEMAEITGYVREYAALFGRDAGALLQAPFYVLTPDTKNPYKQMYVQN